MPRSASATDIHHNSSHQRDTPNPEQDHWLTDPRELEHWQDQLVGFCHAINLQLSQIRSDLSATDEETAVARPVTLRIARSLPQP